MSEASGRWDQAPAIEAGEDSDGSLPPVPAGLPLPAPVTPELPAPPGTPMALEDTGVDETLDVATVHLEDRPGPAGYMRCRLYCSHHTGEQLRETQKVLPKDVSPLRACRGACFPCLLLQYVTWRGQTCAPVNGAFVGRSSGVVDRAWVSSTALGGSQRSSLVQPPVTSRLLRKRLGVTANGLNVSVRCKVTVPLRGWSGMDALLGVGVEKGFFVVAWCW